jgi:hypothetical protein
MPDIDFLPYFYLMDKTERKSVNFFGDREIFSRQFISKKSKSIKPKKITDAGLSLLSLLSLLRN